MFSPVSELPLLLAQVLFITKAGDFAMILKNAVQESANSFQKVKHNTTSAKSILKLAVELKTSINI